MPLGKIIVIQKHAGKVRKLQSFFLSWRKLYDWTDRDEIAQTIIIADLRGSQIIFLGQGRRKLWKYGLGKLFLRKLFSCRYFYWFLLKTLARKVNNKSKKNVVPTIHRPFVGCLFQITFHNVRVVNNFLFKNVGISTGRSSFICLTINYWITGQQISLLCKFPRQNAKKSAKKKLFSLQQNNKPLLCILKHAKFRKRTEKSLELIFIFHAQELRK